MTETNDPHEALRNLISLDGMIARRTRERDAIDAEIRELSQRREAANLVVLQAARGFGLEDAALIRGPHDTLFQLRAGQVTQVQATPSMMLCGEAERAPSGMPVIPAEYNRVPTHDEAESTVTCKYPSPKGDGFPAGD